MYRAIPALALLFGMGMAATAQQPQQQFPGAAPGVQPFGGTPQQQPAGPYDQYWQYANPNSFMPNIYNPATQPLSPYLLTNSMNNPAVNYFFGTRPGTIGMGQRGMGGVPFMAMGGNRTVFFPQLAYAPEPFGQAGVTGTPSVLPPAGHPTVFNNTLGYFPTPFGANGGRGGLMGLGQQMKK
jgi:hypothetical protein